MKPNEIVQFECWREESFFSFDQPDSLLSARSRLQARIYQWLCGLRMSSWRLNRKSVKDFLTPQRTQELLEQTMISELNRIRLGERAIRNVCSVSHQLLERHARTIKSQHHRHVSFFAPRCLLQVDFR